MAKMLGRGSIERNYKILLCFVSLYVIAERDRGRDAGCASSQPVFLSDLVSSRDWSIKPYYIYWRGAVLLATPLLHHRSVLARLPDSLSPDYRTVLCSISPVISGFPGAVRIVIKKTSPTHHVCRKNTTPQKTN